MALLFIAVGFLITAGGIALLIINLAIDIVPLWVLATIIVGGIAVWLIAVRHQDEDGTILDN